MKFRCNQCNAQYMIADEKVGKKGVKVRCKKCGFVIIIRPNVEDEVKPTTAEDDEEDDKELGQFANKLLNDEEDQDDETDMDRQSTRLFSVEEIRRVQAERVQASLEAVERREISTIDQPKPAVLGDEPGLAPQTDNSSLLAEGEPERLEWYVAIDDQQLGPVSLGELSKRKERGELGPDTLVWKAGLDDWMPVRALDELHDLTTTPTNSSVPETQLDQTAPDQQEPIQIGWVAEDAKSPDTVDFSARETAYDTAVDQTSASESVGMDLDWKPTALSVLQSLADEELASLRPVDPEPEAEALPPAETSSTEKVEGAPSAGVGAGGGSIIDQIKADDAATLRSAEQKQAEAAAAVPAAQTPHPDDQLPARRGPIPERQAYPPEPYPPHRASIPNWLVAMLATSGLVIVLLLGVIAYRLLESPRTPPSPIAENQPAPPSAGMGQPTQPPPPAAGSGTVSAASNQPPPNLGTASAGTQPLSPNEAGASQKLITIEKARSRPAVPARAPRAAEDAPKVAERTKTHEEPPPPAQDSGRSKGDVLDFGDEGTKPIVKVAGDKPKELPPLSNVDVMDVMRKHMSEFQACSQKDSSIKGKMMVSFVIVNDGTVSKVSILSDEFKGSGFSECISALIKSIRFPKSGGEPKTVPFPFTVK